MNVAVKLAPKQSTQTEHFDVVIVGAGISGIGSAYHLTQQRPGTSFVVLEALEKMDFIFEFRISSVAEKSISMEVSEKLSTTKTVCSSDWRRKARSIIWISAEMGRGY